jgi:hypothetical protein
VPNKNDEFNKELKEIKEMQEMRLELKKIEFKVQIEILIIKDNLIRLLQIKIMLQLIITINQFQKMRLKTKNSSL